MKEIDTVWEMRYIGALDEPSMKKLPRKIKKAVRAINGRVERRGDRLSKEEREYMDVTLVHLKTDLLLWAGFSV